MSRPYEANYAIGFMFVVGMMLLFEAMCMMSYDEYFKDGYFASLRDYFAVLSSTLMVLSGMLLVGMPLAHKASLAALAVLLVMEMLTLAEEITQNGVLMAAMMVVSMALLLLKPSREFYKGWSARAQPEQMRAKKQFYRKRTVQSPWQAERTARCSSR